MLKYQGEKWKSVVSAVCEASELVRAAALPGMPGETAKAAIWRAARRLGMDSGRVTSLWYRKAKRIDCDEMDRLRAVAMQKQEDAARDHYTELRERIATLEIKLAKALALDAKPYRTVDDLDWHQDY